MKEKNQIESGKVKFLRPLINSNSEMPYFQIFFKDLKGKTLTLSNISKVDTIEAIKNKIKVTTGIPAVDQRLTFGGKQLEDGKKIGNYKIEDASTLHLSLRLKGGALLFNTVVTEKCANDFIKEYDNIEKTANVKKTISSFWKRMLEYPAIINYQKLDKDIKEEIIKINASCKKKGAQGKKLRELGFILYIEKIEKNIKNYIVPVKDIAPMLIKDCEDKFEKGKENENEKEKEKDIANRSKIVSSQICAKLIMAKEKYITHSNLVQDKIAEVGTLNNLSYNNKREIIMAIDKSYDRLGQGLEGLMTDFNARVMLFKRLVNEIILAEEQTSSIFSVIFGVSNEIKASIVKYDEGMVTLTQACLLVGSIPISPTAAVIIGGVIAIKNLVSFFKTVHDYGTLLPAEINIINHELGRCVKIIEGIKTLINERRLKLANEKKIWLKEYNT